MYLEPRISIVARDEILYCGVTSPRIQIFETCRKMGHSCHTGGLTTIVIAFLNNRAYRKGLNLQCFPFIASPSCYFPCCPTYSLNDPAEQSANGFAYLTTTTECHFPPYFTVFPALKGCTVALRAFPTTSGIALFIPGSIMTAIDSFL